MDIKAGPTISSEKQRLMSRYSVNWGSSTPGGVCGATWRNPFSNGDSQQPDSEFSSLKLCADAEPNHAHRSALRITAAGQPINGFPSRLGSTRHR